ncbi:MAG: hypothetical protein AB7G80_07900 [Dongiaceae bacterium]
MAEDDISAAELADQAVDLLAKAKGDADIEQAIDLYAQAIKKEHHQKQRALLAIDAGRAIRRLQNTSPLKKLRWYLDLDNYNSNGFLDVSENHLIALDDAAKDKKREGIEKREKAKDESFYKDHYEMLTACLILLRNDPSLLLEVGKHPESAESFIPYWSDDIESLTAAEAFYTIAATFEPGSNLSDVRFHLLGLAVSAVPKKMLESEELKKKINQALAPHLGREANIFEMRDLKIALGMGKEIPFEQVAISAEQEMEDFSRRVANLVEAAIFDKNEGWELINLITELEYKHNIARQPYAHHTVLLAAAALREMIIENLPPRDEDRRTFLNILRQHMGSCLPRWYSPAECQRPEAKENHATQSTVLAEQLFEIALEALRQRSENSPPAADDLDEDDLDEDGSAEETIREVASSIIENIIHFRATPYNPVQADVLLEEAIFHCLWASQEATDLEKAIETDCWEDMPGGTWEGAFTYFYLVHTPIQAACLLPALLNFLQKKKAEIRVGRIADKIFSFFNDFAAWKTDEDLINSYAALLWQDCDKLEKENPLKALEFYMDKPDPDNEGPWAAEFKRRREESAAKAMRVDPETTKEILNKQLANLTSHGSEKDVAALLALQAKLEGQQKGGGSLPPQAKRYHGREY